MGGFRQVEIKSMSGGCLRWRLEEGWDQVALLIVSVSASKHAQFRASRVMHGR